MAQKRPIARTDTRTQLDAGQRRQTASVLPLGHEATTPEELIREGLLKRLEELERLVGVGALRAKNLTRAELKAIAGRLDAALEGVSGVSARDRTLAWLHAAVVEMATAMECDPSAPASEVGLPLQMFARFCLGSVEQFPRLPGSREMELSDGRKEMVSETRILGPALVAAALALRPGRRSATSGRLPHKWVAFRTLALSEKLIDPMEPDHLRRIVLSAKARLAKIRPPIEKG